MVKYIQLYLLILISRFQAKDGKVFDIDALIFLLSMHFAPIQFIVHIFNYIDNNRVVANRS